MRRHLRGVLRALTPLRVLGVGVTTLALCAGDYLLRRRYADYPI